MEHRGACSADQISGDGAGIMTQIPWDMFKQEFPDLNEQDTGYGLSADISTKLNQFTYNSLQASSSLLLVEVFHQALCRL